MVLYFSGTGNSRFAASLLADELSDELVSLNEVFRQNAPLTFHSRLPFVVVSPIYAWRLPRAVEELLRRGKFSGSSQIYLVVTMGSSFGAAGDYAQKALAQSSLEYRGMAGVVMPDNFVVSFSMPTKQQALPVLKKAAERLKKLARLIAAGQPFPPSRGGALGKLLSGGVNLGFTRFMMSSKAFTVSSQCTRCGSCAAQCPMGNISLTEQGVTFHQNCAFCLGCIHRCPVHAIDYKGKAAKHGYYLCPPKEEILSFSPKT